MKMTGDQRWQQLLRTLAARNFVTAELLTKDHDCQKQRWNEWLAEWALDGFLQRAAPGVYVLGDVPPTFRTGVSETKARGLRDMTRIRERAMQQGGAITVTDIQDLLGYEMEYAQAWACKWARRGQLVYTGRHGEYGVPGVAKVEPTRRRRWNQVLALLESKPAVNARELADAYGGDWHTASAYLRKETTRGHLTRVAPGRFTLAKVGP